MKATKYLWLATLFNIWIFPDSVLAAPITFNTALPVAKNAFINREQVVLRRFKKDRSSADRRLDVNTVVSVLGYGITPKLAVFTAIPYLDKSLSLSMEGLRVSRSSSTIGDVRIFGRYTLFQKDMRSKTFRIAAFGGIKAPTGQNKKTDILGNLPVPLQSGSGSLDEFGGIVATYQTLPFQIDGQLSYRHNGAANSFQAGDQFRADLSLQYRLLPQILTRDTSSFIYGVLETTLLKQETNRLSTTKDPNSGGTTVFITPGFQYVTRKWILETAVQIPLIQNLNGNALKTDFVFTSGFRVNF